MSKSMPASRPVHPCVLSVFEGTTGAEYATWAHITTKADELPNLVTAQGSTIKMYTVEESSCKLRIEHSFTDLAGTVCFLDKLHIDGHADSLLIGFSGHPRLVVAHVATTTTLTSQPIMLEATTLIDLTQPLTDRCMGAVTPLEQDLMATLEQKTSNVATLAVILGGGVAVAALTLRFVRGTNGSGWIASEPYLLPLSSLQQRIAGESSCVADPNNALGPAISHGFGDMTSACFLQGYLEPTLVLLHSSQEHGRTWSGRLGRPNGDGGTQYGMVATALTLTVAHRRSAILWSVTVPADAISLHPVANTGCLVMSTNSLLQISNSGRIGVVLAMNGWAQSSCPFNLLDKLQPNPWPLPKLAIQLDGAQLAFASDNVAILSLRQGQLYLSQNLGGAWSLLPLCKTLGAIGQISALLTLPLVDVPKIMVQKIASDTKQAAGMLSTGFLFAGSRLGDSSLLGYTLESNVTFVDIAKRDGESGKKQKVEDVITNQLTTLDEYEIIFQREEEALYAPTDEHDAEVDGLISTYRDVIPPNTDEDMKEATESGVVENKKRGRQRLLKLTLLRSLNPLDTITSLGPLGPGCVGPLSKTPIQKKPQDATSAQHGATVRIFPCGYGLSGGLALVTLSGRDDRSILAEADCLNVQCVFSLPLRGLVLLGMQGHGISVLRVQGSKLGGTSAKTEAEQSHTCDLSEIDLDEWCSQQSSGRDSLFDCPLSVLRDTTLLSAADFDSNSFAVLVLHDGDSEPVYGLAILSEHDGKLRTVKSHVLASLGYLCSVTPMVTCDHSGETLMVFGCTWSSGKATVVSVSSSGGFDMQAIPGGDANEAEGINTNTDEEQFYRNDSIKAIDVFLAPKETFTGDGDVPSNRRTSSYIDGDVVDGTGSVEFEFDDEDDELYFDAPGLGASMKNIAGTEKAATKQNTPEMDSVYRMHVAICRQSGVMQVFTLSSEMKPVLAESPVWETLGCGQGTSILTSEQDANRRLPRMHNVCTREFRFFFTGPTVVSSNDNSTQNFRTFNLVVETSDGDLHCYQKRKDSSRFLRAPLRDVSRQSKEVARHRLKLRRKGIVSMQDTDDSDITDRYRCNRLHTAKGISGQDGLFAAIARPVWFLSERGSLAVLRHQSRYSAPAGGLPVPVGGFCLGLQGTPDDTDKDFVVLHERIGRVGSQRLTVFRGISNMLSPHCFFPGGGLCVEKIPFGVTVRAIHFLDDSSVSSGTHPLYAVLISRELESDQSILNDDGLPLEERRRKKEEEKSERVKRQVEADLGGFDLEQEWVEEIEREDCFEVDMSFGGAPPIQKRAYALWVVDASNKWSVVDSHEFEEFEHAMSMEVMSLTEVNEEPGAGVSATVEEDNAKNSLFITVGTGIVDKDGEDVSSKGRVLLFEVKRQGSASFGSPVADLSLVYEKEILHGAVASLSCLSCEGRHRLVIGAGADVNVEQWGNGRLTQVGFFRANMQILHIQLFKTFFLLSDAYDSLYFLVWRESDKSLTLLAKDYEPMPVFSAGIMSRGGSMTFVCQDDRENLQFFQYSPGDPAARGGNKLVCRADIHLGSQTVGLQNYFCRSSLVVNSATPTITLAALKSQDSLAGRTDDEQRLGINFGTSDGGMGTIVPVSEPVYWRLTALQSVMANALESNCSLSQRAWRLYRRTARRGGCRSNDRKKSVIDGDLVVQFADLALPDQEDLASAIGSTVELILDNLLELRCASMVV